MVDKEMDRQTGNADQTNNYMIYVLIGLLLFSLILILLLYVMYVYTRNLRNTRIMRVKPINESNSRSKFYGQPMYETMNKKKPPYDAQGPVVQSKSYEECDKIVHETSFSNDNKIASIPAIINS